MTANTPPSPRPAAVAAFLRGLDRRARLLVQVQAGDADAARRALAVAARVFAADAGQWPLAQWPRQYWRLLLSVPAMAQTVAGTPGPLPGVARLAPPVRAAVLLHLVAALEDADAAAALGIGIDAYQQRIRDALPRTPLGQPDVDVWRAWRATAQRALDALPDTPPEAAPIADASSPAQAPGTDAGPPHRRRLRWLWLGVAACAVALAATFFLHPRGRELLDEWRNQVKREALPPADAPKARFDAADPALHPDRDLLAAPYELQLALRLPLLAWLHAEASDALPLDAATPALIAEDGDIAGRMQAWDRLSPQARAAQRGAWTEWQALTDTERATLRATAARFDALPIDQQEALRSRYAQLPFDAHRGWHLGPQLGRFWPRIVALFAQVDADEREPLLRLLREATPEDIDALARLAQTTPPEARATLRRELLAQSPAQRGAWLRERLQR
ncbi:DUF3106 domain-containing protein [Thermomonas brevis]|uniref:DUF3106 domain-containing protein n=1 Tax=Thermomonas brevis TaxID=215691 RepID=A0A7G9QPW9_9GAMM|nr:DUF3106 domain-containing protein [Thermomonas brevis]QNN45394.1 DUF3106 domain-containing protein [Thermomonas brevis]